MSHYATGLSPDTQYYYGVVQSYGGENSDIITGSFSTQAEITYTDEGKAPSNEALTMATWPATLPVPLLAGYSASDEVPMIRTSMSSGPDSAWRCRSIHYMTTGTASLVLDDTQNDTLRNFHPWHSGTRGKLGD